MCVTYDSMGLVKWLRGDKHAVWAEEIERMKDKHMYVRNDFEKTVGMALAQRIQETYKQGSKDHYRYALALWQISNALYPEYVTKKDTPFLFLVFGTVSSDV